MAKKTGVIVVVIIAIIALLYFGGPFNIFGSGFTVTSISTTKVFSNNVNLNNEFFLINVIMTGQNNKIVGTLTPQQFQQESGYQTKFPLTITADVVDQKAIYPIKTESDLETIYQYSVVRIPNPPFTTGPGPCPNDPNGQTTIYEYYIKASGQDRICVVKQQVGVRGSLENPTTSNDVKISVDVNGQKYEQTITPAQSSVNLGSVGSATWTGSLVTGDSAPNQNIYKPVFKFGGSNWNLALDSTSIKYDAKSTSFESGVQGVIGSFSSCNLKKVITSVFFSYTDDSVETCINNFLNSNGVNNDLNTLLTADEDLTGTNIISNTQQITTTSTNPKPSDSNAGQVIVQLNKKLTNPNILFRIQAAWVGVVILTGQPQLIDAECDEVQSGQQQEVTATVKNIGTGSGTFSVKVDNCAPFQQLSSTFSVQQTLQPGEQKDFKVQMVTGNQAVAQATCTVTTFDVNDPSTTDSTTTVCKSTSPKACVSGQQTVNGLCIDQCDANGVFQRQTCCTQVPTIIPGSSPNQYQCPTTTGSAPAVTGSCNKALGFIPSFATGCSTFFQKSKFIGAIILGLIITIISFTYISRTSLSRGVSFLIALLIGGGATAIITII